MESLSEILSFIGRTNLFNFVIFLSIILFLVKKLDVRGSLDAMKNDVAEHIEESKSVKAESETHLSSIEEKISHLEEEIDGIIKSSEANAKLVGEKILEEASKTVDGMNENSRKLVQNKTALLKNDILKRTSDASIEVAKNHIINELNNNYDLHNKFIDESIEAINGVDL